jgi:hypothetical protein
VPWYIFQSIKHRSLLAPFYANPEIENGGFLGESKWDFLKHLDPNSSSTLKAIQIPKQSQIADRQKMIERESFSYPLILKPDVGQRGFGVRVIRDESELSQYLLLANFDLIAQKLSQLPCEAGIFYVRAPGSSHGMLFSITDKKFPVVTGDGVTRLGDLILRDRRARMIASTYFSRLRERLYEIPVQGQTLFLTECGNHCQGAIFKNGEELNTSDLLVAIEKIVSQIPHFYFGRLDVRYKDPASLKKGKDFEIIEINGAGSEATHIWDEKTSLFEAYSTLFTQWRLLFEIGAEVKKSRLAHPRLHCDLFLKECFKVFFRKDKLSVSS